MCVAGCCPFQGCDGINVAGLLGWALRTVMLESFFCLDCVAFVLIFVVIAKEKKLLARK